MLQIENFCKAFKSGPALQNASFTVETGSLVGLVGPSGSGKSVLLKLLGGVMEADQGTVRFDSLPIGSSPEIGFLFQEGALFDSMTVLENVAFPLMRGFHGFDAKRMMRRLSALIKNCVKLACAMPTRSILGN